jgi:hypothetical protein
MDAAADPPVPGLAAGQRADAIPAGPAGGYLAAAQADRPRRPGPQSCGRRHRGPGCWSCRAARWCWPRTHLNCCRTCGPAGRCAAPARRSSPRERTGRARRRSTAVTGAFFRDFRSGPHLPGRCRTFLSGWSDSSIVARAAPSAFRACGRTCLAATSATAWPGRPTTAACWSSASSSSPGRPGPRPATAAPSPAHAAPQSPRPAPISGRPARIAAPAAARSQREAPRHHREQRDSRARPNVATPSPSVQIGGNRSERSQRESAGDERGRADRPTVSSYCV